MGNPKDRAQCEKCMRLPRNVPDENDATKWLDWKKMSVPCKECVEAKE
jgi:hypothetical protein